MHANELAAAQVDFVILDDQPVQHAHMNPPWRRHPRADRHAGLRPRLHDRGHAPSAGPECASVLTGMAKYAAEDLGAKRIAIPATDIPSSVLCYADSEQKPLDVLQGNSRGSITDAGSIPDLERRVSPIPPNEPDLTSIANQILAYEPDAIIFSHCGDGLRFRSAGAMTKRVGCSVEGPDGHVDVLLRPDLRRHGRRCQCGGSTSWDRHFLTQDPATLEGDEAERATLYQRKVIEYGLPEDLVTQLRPAGLHHDHEHGRPRRRGAGRRR